jgi:hypothetical protein
MGRRKEKRDGEREGRMRSKYSDSLKRKKETL